MTRHTQGHFLGSQT